RRPAISVGLLSGWTARGGVGKNEEGRRERLEAMRGRARPAAQRGRREGLQVVERVFDQGHVFLTPPEAMMTSGGRSSRGHLHPCALSAWWTPPGSSIPNS